MQIQPPDLLGGGAFLLGAAIIVVGISIGPVNSYVAGTVLIVIGIAATFGSETFQRVLDKILKARKSGSEKNS